MGVKPQGQGGSEGLRPVDPNEASSILRPLSKKPSNPLEEMTQEELQMLHHDLRTAQQVQVKLLPERVPQIPGYDFDAYYSPAGELGGDFYDFIQFDKEHLGILVADASGKGMSGSLLMVEARAVLRSMASVSASPKDILKLANRVLLQDLKRGMFITIFYALLDITQGTLRMASAGHMPMLLWKWKTRKCYAVNPSGLVLGTATEEMFNETIKETSIEFESGDRFILYTDGVTELMDIDDKEFGNGRLVRCTMKNAPRTSAEYVRNLVAELDGHRSGLAQSDDITIVTGRRYPEEEMFPDRPASPESNARLIGRGGNQRSP